MTEETDCGKSDERTVAVAHPPAVDLRRLYRILSTHRRLFQTIFEDLSRLREGTNRYFCLDFDYLHAYAEPWSLKEVEGKPLDSVAISYVLERSDTRFVLLPGTILELAAYVGHEANRVPDLRRRFEKLKSEVGEEELARLIGIVLGSDELPDPRSLSSSESKTAVKRLLFEAHEGVSKLHRLHMLISGDRFTTLEEIYPGADLDLDPDVLKSYENALNELRPKGIGRRNYADAVNFQALMAARRTSRGPDVYLLTRTGTFGKRAFADLEDTFAKRYGMESSVLRFPVEALYWVVLERRFPDIQARFEFMVEARKICDDALHVLETYWRHHPLDVPSRAYPSLQAALTGLSEPQDHGIMKKLRDYLEEVVVQEIEDYASANQSVNANVQILIGEKSSGISASEAFTAITQRQKIIARAIVQVMERKALLPHVGKTTSLPKRPEMGRLVTSTFRHFYSEFPSDVMDDPIGQKTTKVITLRDRGAREVVAIASHGDIRTVYWPMNIDVGEVCETINELADVHGEERLNVNMILPDKGKLTALSIPLTSQQIRRRSGGQLPRRVFVRLELQPQRILSLSFDLQPVSDPFLLYFAIEGTTNFEEFAISLFSNSSRHMIFSSFVRRFLKKHW